MKVGQTFLPVGVGTGSCSRQAEEKRFSIIHFKFSISHLAAIFGLAQIIWI
jgi:hypothetical protein